MRDLTALKNHMMPTNLRLLDPDLDADSPEAERALVRWGRFHAARTVAGLGVFAAFVVMLLRNE